MSAQYEHAINASIPLTVTYPASGPHESYSVLHATGCNHTHRKSLQDSIPFQGNEAYYADDYFKVAPCAKEKKTKKK